MSNLKDKLDRITAKEPSKWLENAKWREKNADWLDKSAKIALKILRKLRAKKMTQKELAYHLEVSPQFINKIVKGQQNLTLETVSKIENILGIELISILGVSESTQMLEENPSTSGISQSFQTDPGSEVSSHTAKCNYNPTETVYVPDPEPESLYQLAA